MSQNIFDTIVPTTTSGNQLAVILNDFKDAVVSGFSGTTRPSELDAGGYWIDTSNPNLWAYKMYTGVQDITIFTLNLSTGSSSISSADSSFEIIKISADSLGPVLKLIKERVVGNGQTLDGDILGEIEFYATRDSGVNVATARIRAVSSDDTTSSAQGTYLVFEGTNDLEGSVSEWMRIVDGKVGIGTPTPEKSLHVAGQLKLEEESDTTVGADIELKKKRITNQGQVLSGDFLSKIEINSHDSSDNNVPGVLVEVKAAENHTVSGHGTSISIKNKKIGETVFTEQIFIGDKVEIKGDMEIAGDLLVQGTTTTVDTETIEVQDPNILVNKGGTQLTANTAKAGITVDISDGTDALIGYDSTTASKFVIGNVGSESEIVTATHTQSLTNKTIDSDLNTISNIDNADIKAAAAIDRSKLASGSANRLVVNNALGVQSDAAGITANRALVSDANGIPTHTAVTNTELGYVSGVTSAIQTQLNAKTDEVGGTLTSGSVITPARLDTKQDTFSNLQTYAATASNGQLVFATDLKQTYQIIDNALKLVGGEPFISPIVVVDSTPYNVSGSGALLLVNTTTAARTINLPTSPELGDKVIIKDDRGNCGTNNITVTKNASHTIERLNSNYILESNFGSWIFVFDGTNNWVIL